VLRRLQWRWRTELVAEVKCLTENVCLQPGFKHSEQAEFFAFLAFPGGFFSSQRLSTFMLFTLAMHY